MSIKIYSGYRMGFIDLFEMRHQIEVKMKPLLIRDIYQKILTEVIFNYDLSHYGGGEFTKGIDRDFKDTGFYKYRSEAIDKYNWQSLWGLSLLLRQKDLKSKMISSQNFEIVYLQHPQTKEVFAIIYGSNSMEQFFEENFAEEYRYWNNSDQPDELTDEMWNERYKTWNAILNMDRPTGVQGLTQKILSDYESEPYLSNLLDIEGLIVPSFEERAKNLAAAFVDKEYFKENPQSEDVMRYLFSQERSEKVEKVTPEMLRSLSEISLEKIVEKV